MAVETVGPVRDRLVSLQNGDRLADNYALGLRRKDMIVASRRGAARDFVSRLARSDPK